MRDGVGESTKKLRVGRECVCVDWGKNVDWGKKKVGRVNRESCS